MSECELCGATEGLDRLMDHEEERREGTVEDGGG